MITQGSQGSLLCFIDEKIIASIPLTRKKPLEYFKQMAEDILIRALREGKWTVQTAGIRTLRILFERKFYSRKKLSREDSESIILMAFILHKLKIWDYDDPLNGLFIAPRKKLRVKTP